MNKEIVKKQDQELWHIIFAIIFALLFVTSLFILDEYSTLPQSIKIFDAVLIVLAVFRLIRLFVYDDVAQFVRDITIDEETISDGNDEYYIKTKPEHGFKRATNDLITCPWCMGVWLAWIVTFFYFLTPYAWFVIFFLAVAGTASVLQIISNILVGLQKNIKAK